VDDHAQLAVVEILPYEEVSRLRAAGHSSALNGGLSLRYGSMDRERERCKHDAMPKIHVILPRRSIDHQGVPTMIH
jgi:hypothetical protein